MAKLQGTPIALPGMERHEAERAEVAGVELAADLTAKLLQPTNIEARAGALEMNSPLFRGTDASPQTELFS